MWPDTWQQWVLVSPLIALISITVIAVLLVFDRNPS